MCTKPGSKRKSIPIGPQSHYALCCKHLRELKISILVHYSTKIRRDESRNVKKRTPKTETTTIDTRQQAQGYRRNRVGESEYVGIKCCSAGGCPEAWPVRWRRLAYSNFHHIFCFVSGVRHPRVWSGGRSETHVISTRGPSSFSQSEASFWTRNHPDITVFDPDPRIRK